MEIHKVITERDLLDKLLMEGFHGKVEERHEGFMGDYFTFVMRSPMFNAVALNTILKLGWKLDKITVVDGNLEISFYMNEFCFSF